jgi:hypothetical protein
MRMPTGQREKFCMTRRILKKENILILMIWPCLEHKEKSIKVFKEKGYV